MAAYRPESTVMVRPFASRREGDEVFIADPDRRLYLAIPAEGLDILQSLAAGNTIAETVRRYERTYGETPDIDDFLGILAAEGFIGEGLRPNGQVPAHTKRRTRTVSLDWISPTVAARLSSTPVVLTCLAIIAAGLGVVLTEPSLVPPTTIFLFPDGSFAASILITLAISAAATVVHELAHAVVGRAVGAPVTLGIGNLMYSVVAQTDVSGLWMAPKRRRYLAFAAGALVDLACASGLVFLLYAARHGWVNLPPDAAAIVGAVLLTYLFRVTFQFNFYLRTDLYYLVASAFNCKDLMTDTETRLKNLVFRLTGRSHRVVDQSGLDRRERIAVGLYSVVYLLGRALAIAVLVFFVLPVLAGIAYQFMLFVTGRDSHLGSVDFVVFALVLSVFWGGGVLMWFRSLYHASRHNRLAHAS